MLGELNQTQIDYVLRSQAVGRLGCCAGGQVYIVPITYVYEDPYIYGHTKEGLKVNMMRKNPHVCFEVDIIQNLANWQSVILQGEYEELSGQENQQALEIIKSRITPLLSSEFILPAASPDIHHSITASRLVRVSYRILINHKTGRYEKR
ncbi:pyridoxamine 5'-phosphate oxidase family protein [Adhaeribacter rhizoryzae]|uniref:Pyridoxamine 5'-phosphate oxidase family protein n=1 Tax=Adhaeribacter rhizoryzae TaxID=2607907 RepID=A0A5M6D2P9_9BACT|nr:pyridoxamine 5'-phosphate oxidase family protein [Adhaeribacter rhizoryzae]KAA5539949.1 pyridoxamine 5'-phosphate oxidase family protein [Adhaeribacter rhizoryzae]